MGATMNDRLHLRDWLIDGVLILLALPVLALRGVLRLRKTRRMIAALRRPAIACRTCSAPIPLARMARCPCGWTEANTVLACSRCGALFNVVRCACGATNTVF
jgi:hypothetical protein